MLSAFGLNVNSKLELDANTPIASLLLVFKFLAVNSFPAVKKVVWFRIPITSENDVGSS